jgi:hypothetical protein
MNKGTGWVWSVVAPFSFAASVAFAGAFDGSNPTTAPLLWQGFSNGFVAAPVTGPSFNGTMAAGQFFGEFDGDLGGLGPDDFFRFFCMELSQPVDQSNSNLYTRQTPPPDLSPTVIAELSQLFNSHYPHPELGTYYANGQPTDFGNFPDTTSSAAFQIALLEIVYDGLSTIDLSSGNFTANIGGSLLTAVQADLAGINTGSPLAPGWTFFEFTNASLQNFISAETSPTLLILPAPEPGTLVLVAAAGLALIAAMRRRQIV